MLIIAFTVLIFLSCIVTFHLSGTDFFKPDVEMTDPLECTDEKEL